MAGIVNKVNGNGLSRVERRCHTRRMDTVVQHWAVPRDGGLWEVWVGVHEGGRYAERQYSVPVTERTALLILRREKASRDG
jgi:hypothetical protein